MSVNEVEDLTMFCRVCLQLPSEPELLDLNLIYDEEDQLTYHDCFTMCTQINICEGEGLPQNLCRSCGLELQMAYDFHKKVEESKRVLLQLLDQQADAGITAVEEVVETERLIEVEEDEEGVTGEEEHLDMEYQAVEHLEEEDLDYKTEVFIKEEATEEVKEEILANMNNLTTTDYKDYALSTNSDEAQLQSIDMKTESVSKLSESENEVDEEFTFDDLYNKVFEDVKIEQSVELDAEITVKTFPLKRRRRGRPSVKRVGSEDDPDLMLDEIEAALDKKSNEENEKQNSANKKSILRIEEELGMESDSNLSAPAAKQRKPRTIRSANNDKDGPPFECEVCQLPCKSRSLLNSHRFRKHRPQEEPKFHCPDCNRGFTNQESLERHMRRPTCDAYPQFDCEHCGKKCVGLSNYKIHLRFHKRQYPFVCHLCGKKFMMCVHLNEHVLVKHENKRYPCEHPGCGKLFQTRNSLYNHAYQHKGFMPYECEYCKRGYASKSRLRFHCKKSHDIDHTIEELDRMQVTEKLPNPVVKPQ